MRERLEEEIKELVDLEEMEDSFFLVGLLNQLMNRFQTVGDHFFSEISWKQCFVLICTGLFKTPPTIKELAHAMGCSHQNVKQMLIKLEKAGYLKIIIDQEDRRKQRVILTEKTARFNKQNDQPSVEFMTKLFEGIDEKELESTVKTCMKLDKKLKKLQVEYSGK